MIRINLTPRKRGRRRGWSFGSNGAERSGSGTTWLLMILLVWVGIGLFGRWLFVVEVEAEQQLRTQHAQTRAEIEKIKQDIDEKELKRRQAELEQISSAIDRIGQYRRTPVYVMYELAMILTDARDGGGPDIDQEKYRQQLRDDPQSRINDQWDPSGLWIERMSETDSVLTLSGHARDATDLTEFARRLRASARFGDLDNPTYGRGKSGDNTLEWTLRVKVQRWD